MRPSDDSPRPRRPLLLPVLLAAVLLAVIGASTGMVLGSRAKRTSDAAQDPAVDNSAFPAPVPGSGMSPPGRVNDPAPPPWPRVACRSEAQAEITKAGGSTDVWIVLHVTTATSQVWICGDASGRLYYVANQRTAGNTWVAGRTALVLPDVFVAGDDYVAVDTDAKGRQTQFYVNHGGLRIAHPDGTVETQRGVDG